MFLINEYKIQKVVSVSIEFFRFSDKITFWQKKKKVLWDFVQIMFEGRNISCWFLNNSSWNNLKNILIVTTELIMPNEPLIGD